MRTISKIVDNGEVTPSLSETFGKIQNALQAPFTPHFFQVWATSEESLNGIWPVMKHILTSGKVSRKLKEMIFVAISSYKGCNYCQSAHHAFCLSIGVTPEQIDDLINDYTAPTATPKEKAAIDLAMRLARDPHSSSEEDFKELADHGYSTEEVMEVIAMSGMGVFYTHLANATKINVDTGFKKKIQASNAETLEA
jgi:uncharacterized peroxidase-related enzyme